MIKLFVLLLTASLVSCATVQNSSYTPPAAKNYANTIIFDKSKDEVWSALVDSASSSFFAIKNFEKDSGLMTLDFGGSAEDYVDCGTWTGNGLTDHNYIMRNKRMGFKMPLSGVINLLVLQLDANKTSLRVNARYILDMNASGSQYNFITGQNVGYSTSETFNFDSNGSDTIFISNASPGTSTSRTCQPNGEVESRIVDDVKRILGI